MEADDIVQDNLRYKMPLTKDVRTPFFVVCTDTEFRNFKSTSRPKPYSITIRRSTKTSSFRISLAKALNKQEKVRVMPLIQAAMAMVIRQRSGDQHSFQGHQTT